MHLPDDDPLVTAQRRAYREKMFQILEDGMGFTRDQLDEICRDPESRQLLRELIEDITKASDRMKWWKDAFKRAMREGGRFGTRIFLFLSVLFFMSEAKACDDLDAAGDHVAAGRRRGELWGGLVGGILGGFFGPFGGILGGLLGSGLGGFIGQGVTPENEQEGRRRRGGRSCLYPDPVRPEGLPTPDPSPFGIPPQPPLTPVPGGFPTPGGFPDPQREKIREWLGGGSSPSTAGLN